MYKKVQRDLVTTLHWPSCMLDQRFPQEWADGNSGFSVPSSMHMCLKITQFSISLLLVLENLKFSAYFIFIYNKIVQTINL